MCASISSKPYQMWEGDLFLSYYPLWDEWYLGLTEPVLIPDLTVLEEDALFQLSTVMNITTIRKLQYAIKGRIQ